eukprot:TRINITY_DN41546_c0_g1_i1.p1 TRINITY_DN41546_c0_g1~~TRINITY_DN41546_c0_g1_i1.p1  ORF type:complete len:427 (+),score=102.38 TRINITY_DN41546_c0_g1_i1:141-1421(+)
MAATTAAAARRGVRASVTSTRPGSSATPRSSGTSGVGGGAAASSSRGAGTATGTRSSTPTSAAGPGALHRAGTMALARPPRASAGSGSGAGNSQATVSPSAGAGGAAATGRTRTSASHPSSSSAQGYQPRSSQLRPSVPRAPSRGSGGSRAPVGSGGISAAAAAGAGASGSAGAAGPRDHDERLMQLLSLAAMQGLGDIDPEPAAAVLEAASWNVDDALAQLRGGPGGSAQGARGGGGAVRAGLGSRSAAAEDETAMLMRLQEEEWNGVSAAEEARRAALGHLAAFDDASIVAALMGMGGAGGLREAMRQSMLESYAIGLGGIDDEAGLANAMRMSTEEDYSGGFGPPPVDAATMERATRICTYSGPSAGEEEEECSICLVGFEEGNELRTLPCLHRFHSHCVDQWLIQSGQCPVCKHDIARAQAE